jgi:hypothetical protein
MKRIIDGIKESNFELDDPNYAYKLHKITNLINYEYINNLMEVEYVDGQLDTSETQHYFVLESANTAFAHWIYESFIFYPMIKHLVAMYPKLKILTTKTHKYYTNFINFVSIDLEIVYKKNINKNNICFIHPVISLNDQNLDLKMFESHLTTFRNNIINIIPKETNKKLLTLLPRQQLEQYHVRTVYGIGNIIENVINIAGVVLDTHNINNIYLQALIINNSKTIILDFGSSYLVNGMMATGSKIIVLDNYNLSHPQFHITSTLFLHNYIKRHNEVIIVHPKRGNEILFEDIEQYLK